MSGPSQKAMIARRLAERRAKQILEGVVQGWDEIPRDRAVRAHVVNLPNLGECVVEWRGQAPNYIPQRRRG